MEATLHTRLCAIAGSGADECFEHCCLETLGSFLMCLAYMILNENHDNIRDPSLMSLFWAIAFVCCLTMTAQITGGSLNPLRQSGQKSRARRLSEKM